MALCRAGRQKARDICSPTWLKLLKCWVGFGSLTPVPTVGTWSLTHRVLTRTALTSRARFFGCRGGAGAPLAGPGVARGLPNPRHVRRARARPHPQGRPFADSTSGSNVPGPRGGVVGRPPTGLVLRTVTPGRPPPV